MYRKVLVTGATGNIASLVIPQLVAKGIQVNAYVHNKSKADKIKQKGVEIFEGEFTDQNAMNEAAKGTDAVLSITPPNENAVAQASTILKATKYANAKFHLRISALKAGKEAPTANGRLHFQTDTEIIASGIPYTILRPHFFMQNLFWSVSNIIGQSSIYAAMGDGKLGLIDVRDIADCVVSLLTKGGHENKIYTPTGPASIDYNEIAQIISEGLGKKVNNVNVPFEAVGESILSMGMDKWFADVMVDYSKAYASNWGNFTNDDVEKITGHKARSFQQFFDEVLSPALTQVNVTTN
jgi:uncharacterized protein YbjT (DUF2867 family)